MERTELSDADGKNALLFHYKGDCRGLLSHLTPVVRLKLEHFPGSRFNLAEVRKPHTNKQASEHVNALKPELLCFLIYLFIFCKKRASSKKREREAQY